MSTTFRLSGASFNRQAWLAELQGLLSGNAGWIPLKCMASLYPDSKADPFKRGNIVLLGKGSSRGVLLDSQAEHIEVELMSLASEVDWDVARWLLDAGQKLGAKVTDEDGQVLQAEGLSRQAFQTMSQKVLSNDLNTARAISSKDGNSALRFPVAHFELNVSNAELISLELDPLMDLLVNQCYRYGNAHIARRMEWQKSGEASLKLAHYSSISTLVPSDIEAMTLSGPEGYYSLQPILIGKVKEILSAFVQPVGNYLYFAPIPWDKNLALLETVTGKSVKEIFESLDHQLGDALVRLPVLAFVMVAHADGEVDQKEIQTFMDYVSKIAANENDKSTFANSCRRLQHEMKQTIAEVKGLSHVSEFQMAVSQADFRLKEETATAYKNRLYELAETVAKASGGGFLGIGSRISDSEQTALDWIKNVLFPKKEQ